MVPVIIYPSIVLLFHLSCFFPYFPLFVFPVYGSQTVFAMLHLPSDYYVSSIFYFNYCIRPLFVLRTMCYFFLFFVGDAYHN